MAENQTADLIYQSRDSSKKIANLLFRTFDKFFELGQYLQIKEVCLILYNIT